MENFGKFVVLSALYVPPAAVLGIPLGVPLAKAFANSKAIEEGNYDLESLMVDPSDAMLCLLGSMLAMSALAVSIAFKHSRP